MSIITDACLDDWGKHHNPIGKFKPGDRVIFKNTGKLHTIITSNPYSCRPSEMEYIISDWDYLVWEIELTKAG